MDRIVIKKWSKAVVYSLVFSTFLYISCTDTLIEDIKEKIARDESSDTRLSGLEITTGNMYPVFSSDTTRYYVLLDSEYDTTEVTATVNYPDATVEVNGIAVASGTLSDTINLDHGANSINVKVTASNGSDTRLYVISVCRATVDLPKTGQTASYLAGDDGDLEKGYPRPIVRFTEDTGTVSDSLTGLMWVQTPNSTNRTWSNAITYAENLTVNFHNDWRMPNINELRSLFNYQTANPADWLNSQEFSGVQNTHYWMSTTCRPLTERSWVVYMFTGYFDFFPKTFDRPVFAVRDSGSPGVISLPRTGQTVSHTDYDDGYYEAGVAWPTPRFADNGNGTITDNLTALMWERVPSDSMTDWSNAIADANSLTLADFNDWHLPNINELESLYNPGVDDLKTWLESENFELPTTIGLFWTSTTYAPNSSEAWFIQMSSNWQNGYIYHTGKGSPGVYGPAYGWAVRSGR